MKNFTNAIFRNLPTAILQFNGFASVASVVRNSYIHDEKLRIPLNPPSPELRLPHAITPLINVNSVGSLDHPDGEGARDDRALREQSGKVRGHLLRSELVWIRHESRSRVQDLYVEFEGEVCIVPPNSFALARSVEYFRIPRNVVTITVGKSTYARCGIITNVTPFEPEWEGFVTLEISNTTPLPAKIYANEGIAQVLFFKGEEEPMVSYKDKKGKYQGQQGVTLPRL